MKVVVTGATGMIGSALVRALVERGDEVTALSRSPDDAASKLGVDAVGWKDPLSEPAPADALRGRDAVVHLLGEPVAQRWTDDARREIRDSRVLGTRNLVAGLAALPGGRAPGDPGVPVGERLVRRPRRRATRRVGARGRRLPRPGHAGLGGGGAGRRGAGPARGDHAHRGGSGRSPAARSRRCCRPSSSGVGGPVAGGQPVRALDPPRRRGGSDAVLPSTRRRRPAP